MAGRAEPLLASPLIVGFQTSAQHQGLKEPLWNKAQFIENSGFCGSPSCSMVPGFSALQPEMGVGPDLLSRTWTQPDAHTAGLQLYAGPGEGLRALIEP